MIEAPYPPNGCNYHEITDLLVNPATGVIGVSVGSWVTSPEGTPPVASRTLDVLWPGWVTDRYEQMPAVVNNHPDWNGLLPGKQQEGFLFNWETKQWEDPLPPSERLAIQWETVRSQRTALLKSSDWVVLRAQETNQPIPLSWLEYRQALRDITLQPDPTNITWPVAP